MKLLYNPPSPGGRELEGGGYTPVLSLDGRGFR